jgi:methylenetetrahydrofolate dehydrogenase (NADP+)/methenyltetrahydrofolate cyclohydrolase/formyltetrahydrofolate synthetase
MKFVSENILQSIYHSPLNFQGYNRLPVCMAKTPLSLTGDPAVKGAPTGFKLPIKNIFVSAGAGFVVPIVGEVSFMFLDFRFSKYLL